jgi:hypothetical protein
VRIKDNVLQRIAEAGRESEVRDAMQLATANVAGAENAGEPDNAAEMEAMQIGFEAGRLAAEREQSERAPKVAPVIAPNGSPFGVAEPPSQANRMAAYVAAPVSREHFGSFTSPPRQVTLSKEQWRFVQAEAQRQGIDVSEYARNYVNGITEMNRRKALGDIQM